MPFFGGFQYAVTSDRIVITGDIEIPAAYQLKTDKIDVITPGAKLTTVSKTDGFGDGVWAAAMRGA